MANKRIKKKKEKKRISAIKLKKAKLTSAEALLKKQLKILESQIKASSALKDPTKINVKIEKREKVIKVKRDNWKKRNVDRIVGKKKWTDGQKNFARAIQTIENALGNVAEDIKMKYGSDDIEELANQYYVAELGGYQPEELEEIESEFNKSHGYHIRLQKAKNPFKDIDFLSM